MDSGEMYRAVKTKKETQSDKFLQRQREQDSAYCVLGRPMQGFFSFPWNLGLHEAILLI